MTRADSISQRVPYGICFGGAVLGATSEKPSPTVNISHLYEILSTREFQKCEIRSLLLVHMQIKANLYFLKTTFS